MVFIVPSVGNTKVLFGIRAGLVLVSWAIWVYTVYAGPAFRLGSFFQNDLSGSEMSEFTMDPSG